MSLPPTPWSGIWMHIAALPISKEGWRGWLCLPVCLVFLNPLRVSGGVQKGSQQWLACFHSAAQPPVFFGCTCPVHQVNVSWIGRNDLLIMERQEDILGSPHQSEYLQFMADVNFQKLSASFIKRITEWILLCKYELFFWSHLLLWNAHTFPEGLQHWDTTISHQQFS